MHITICAAGELWGGVERFIDTFAHALRGRGCTVDACLFAEGPLETALTKHGIAVHLGPRSFSHDPAAVPWLIRMLKRGPTTVLHTHGYKAAVIGGLAALMTRTPIVHTVHGLREPAAGFNRVKMATNYWLERMMVHHVVDAAVSVTHRLHAELGLERLGPRTTVIWNGVAPFPMQPPIPLRDLPSGEAAAFRLGIVGRIVPVKGHRTLLTALARPAAPANLHLYVLGTGPDERECRELAVSLGVGERVHFLGFKEDVHRYLLSLDAVAIPSLYEGLPYVLLESFYLGVPIIASAVGGLSEVITQGVTGLLVTPSDPDEWARALARLSRDRALRDSLAVGGKEAVTRHFSIDMTVSSYLEVFEHVADGGA